MLKFEIWGLTGTLTTEHDAQMDDATKRLWYRLDAVDASCNRFRDDSELSRLNDSNGATVAISSTLELALEAALRAADVTGAMVDPTVLPALLALGYDRDFDELATGDPIPPHVAVPSMGPSSIHLDRDEHTVSLDPPCQLDLGASAKALVVDLVADDVAIPPWRRVMRGSFPWRTSASLTAIAQGPCGPSPRTATSPPSSTTTPPDCATSSATRSTTSALALAPRSS